MSSNQSSNDEALPVVENDYVNVNLVHEMEQSYLDYAMSVIMGRALPDVRDGLKPVHRRVLYAMHEMGNLWNRAYKKSARVVGNVIGKYHPHGDAAAYDTIVRMAQDFSIRYPLVDGQGNFGSIDGDSAAAMRYTEVRLQRIASEMLDGIDEDTVNFVPNYDGAEQEPTVLPTRLPALLVNGAAGIAVGMATNIPPHNLNEVVNACLLVLDKPDCTLDEIMTVLPGPDFPTGGTIYGLDGVREGYSTGRGRVVIRGKTHIEEFDNGREAIVITEIPYQINKAQLLEKIAQLGVEKKIEGISYVRDESDSKIRGVIELKRGAHADVVLNNIYKMTELESSFGINLVALVNGQPQLLSVKRIIEEFLWHRREVVNRKTMFRLNQSRGRLYMLEGQAIALANLDDFLEIIRTSANGQEAETRLLSRSWNSTLMTQLVQRSDIDRKYMRPEDEDMSKGLQADGTYTLTSAQAKNILQMRLQSLTGLEQEKIKNEYHELVDAVIDLVDILNKPERVTQIIAQDLRDLQTNYGDERRTDIVADARNVKTKDLIPLREMVVTLTDTGYIKSQASVEYRAQKRGGMGRKAAEIKEGDIITNLFVATTHDTLLCFTDKGRMFWLNVWDLPEGSYTSKGRPIVNLLELNGEKVQVILPISDEDYKKDLYVFMATANGTVKKTPIGDFKNQRKMGINAINLLENDRLIGVAVTNGHNDIMLFSDEGKTVRFNEEQVRSMGRAATGVRGMRLKDDGQVISMLVVTDENKAVLTATANGYGKRTPVAEYPRHGRGGQGIISIQTSERNGKVVAAILVDEADEIILLNSAGKLVRTRVCEVRMMGRNTQGVRLISMDKDVSLIAIERVTENDDDQVEPNPVSEQNPTVVQDNLEVTDPAEETDAEDTTVTDETDNEENS